MMQKWMLKIIIIISLTGCEKEVEVDLPTHKSQIIVEGWIEQGKGPKVLLSLSAPFFTDIDSNNLRDYAVTRAKVTVRSKTKEEILTLKPNNVYFPPYYYFGIDIEGATDQEYELEIKYQGETFISSTTIPTVTEPDSAWFVKEPSSDTLGLIWFKLSDDAAEKNYYRTLTKRIGKDTRYIPTFTSIFSDNLFNGETIEISLSRGKINILDIESDRFFNVGDTIVLKFCSIDKEHYLFWNTLQSQIISSANPFAATNSVVESNVIRGIGIWGGYAVSYDTIIAN